MRCVVTAGPTYESLDDVRRLTNFSTGRLGSELATFLSARGHEVTLLIGEQATFGGARQAAKIETFTTTENLRERLKKLSEGFEGAVFHAAAVSDFTFGKVWVRSTQGELTEIKSGKLSTRQGTLLAELVPTPKIIAELRQWYPRARIIGWKFEVEGGRDGVLALAKKQITECHTDACVANGAAYGPGFGLLAKDGELFHADDTPALFEILTRFIS
jgi:phosphopantothenoylcysteine decarboxylase/phosphopantothenate--cysteine ligase